MKVELRYLGELVHKQLKQEYGESTELSVRQIGIFLCGDEWELARKPFSREFLEHITFNGVKAHYSVLYLQLRSLEISSRIKSTRQFNKIY